MSRGVSEQKAARFASTGWPHSPLTPLTWIRNFCTGRLGWALVHVSVALSAAIPVRETSGLSGTSRPRIPMSSGTGFHRVWDARRRSLWGAQTGKSHGLARSSSPQKQRAGRVITHQTTAAPVNSILALDATKPARKLSTLRSRSVLAQ